MKLFEKMKIFEKIENQTSNCFSRTGLTGREKIVTLTPWKICNFSACV